MRLRSVIILTLALVQTVPSAHAKRGPAPKVPPIITNGIEYRSLNADSGGVVQSIDLATGRTNWETIVYRNWIIPLMEEDVQLVCISDLQLKDEHLIIRNERSKTFVVDAKTGYLVNNWPAPWAFAIILIALVVVCVWLSMRKQRLTAKDTHLI